MKCYYCMEWVSPTEHTNVLRSMLLLLGEACDNEVHIGVAENSFVHMIQASGSLDTDGNVVVCAKDFVREVAENWQLMPSESEQRVLDGNR